MLLIVKAVIVRKDFALLENTEYIDRPAAMQKQKQDQRTELEPKPDYILEEPAGAE